MTEHGPLIGVTDAVCPYCDQRLKKMPARKTECRSCGNVIFVQTRSEDKVRVLLRADELLALEVDALALEVDAISRSRVEMLGELFRGGIWGGNMPTTLSDMADTSKHEGRIEALARKEKSLNEKLARKQAALEIARTKIQVPRTSGLTDDAQATSSEPSAGKNAQEGPSLGVAQVTTSGRLRFLCPNCGKAINAPAESVGRKGKCPGCGQRVQVPQPAVPRNDDIVATFADGPAIDRPKEGTQVETPQPQTSPTAPAEPVVIPPLTATERSREPQPLIGVRDAVCPYCAHRLAKMPGRKKKCPACGNDIFVRTRPQDKVRILVRADQLLAIEEEWSVVNRAHQHIACAVTIHDLADGQLGAMEALGAKQISAMVEWSTATGSSVPVTHRGHLSPCPLCAPLSNIVLTIEEARGMIPRHESCRCCFTPANVGESPTGQKRTKEQIEEAIALSVMAEIPEGSNRTLAEQRELSSWAGAKKVISATRAKPFVVGG